MKRLYLDRKLLCMKLYLREDILAENGRPQIAKFAAKVKAFGYACTRSSKIVEKIGIMFFVK